MDQARQVLRYHHYAYRAEDTYCEWIKQYLRFFSRTATKPLECLYSQGLCLLLEMGVYYPDGTLGLNVGHPDLFKGFDICQYPGGKI